MGKQSHLNKPKQDKFVLSMPLPAVLRGIDSKVERANRYVKGDSFRVSVHGAPVPAVTVPSKEIGMFGQVLRVSSHARPVYDNVVVKFAIDNQYDNYWVCWKWLDMLNDAKESKYNTKLIGSHLNPTPYQPDTAKEDMIPEYTTNITVIGKDEYNADKIMFTYSLAFPVRVGMIEYTYKDVNLLECEFEFAFTQMDVKLV